MWWALLVYQLALIRLVQTQNDVCSTHPTFREPANNDMDVFCGTDRVDIQILLCPIYFNGHNETLMALNTQALNKDCRGTPNWTVNPPVLKFGFSITEEALSVCNNKIKITQEVGTGPFAEFSSIQFVNISGMINSLELSSGTITYRKPMIYKFSCRYPLQYLVNATEMSVSGVRLAVVDRNGSFISTLSMSLYSDRFYRSQLQIPEEGLQLKTRIFVAVKATNLTERFSVLLDRCFSTASSNPFASIYYDLFRGCTRGGQTVMGVNGQQQEARFSFEAFRFLQPINTRLSTFYLHCVTRLCERTVCISLLQNCTDNISGLRKKRQVEDTSVTDAATVTSGQILTQLHNVVEQSSGTHATVKWVSIATGVVSLCLSIVTYITYRIIVARTNGAREQNVLQT